MDEEDKMVSESLQTKQEFAGIQRPMNLNEKVADILATTLSVNKNITIGERILENLDPKKKKIRKFRLQEYEGINLLKKEITKKSGVQGIGYNLFGN